MKRTTIVSLLILTTVCLTGCWSHKEINEIEVVSGIGVDKEKGQLRTSVQLVVPSAVSAKSSIDTSNGTPITLLSATSKSISESIRKMTIDSPKVLYTSHLRVFVISEEIAKEGIGHVLDYLARDYSYRTDFYLIVAKGTSAESILKVMSPMGKVSSNVLYQSMEVSEKVWAPSTPITLEKTLGMLAAGEKEIVLTSVDIIGDREIIESTKNIETVKPPSQMRIEELAVFKGDRLVGWLNERESKGYNYILNLIHSTVGTIPCPKEGTFAVNVTNSKTKMKPIFKHGKPEIQLSLKTEAAINEMNCSVDLTKNETIDKLEEQTKKVIKTNMDLALIKAQTQYHSDIFGFSTQIHRSYPSYWKKHKKTWDQEFVTLPVTISIDLHLTNLGSIANPIDIKKKERK